jgi:SpoU rRNA methylase family enzyme
VVFGRVRRLSGLVSTARLDPEVGEAKAVVAFTAFATAAGSGVPIAQRYWQGVHLRDGLVDYVGFFRSEHDALEALRREGRSRV